jgi:hypothetical protein
MTRINCNNFHDFRCFADVKLDPYFTPCTHFSNTGPFMRKLIQFDMGFRKSRGYID